MSKSNEKYTEDYSNMKDMPIRTRFALLLILLAIKVCEPWNYSHQFEKDLNGLRDILLGKESKS
jgi:hypothetical protein